MYMLRYKFREAADLQGGATDLQGGANAPPPPRPPKCGPEGVCGMGLDGHRA